MTISAYKSPYPIIEKQVATKPIRLDRNENPCGASPFAIKAAQQALLGCHRYPQMHGDALKLSLATHLGVSHESITLGNGSEGLLALLGRTYLTTKDSALLTNYSFIRLKKILQPSGAALKIAKNSPQFINSAHILEAIEPTTKIIFIVNPNNPTGTYINSLELSYLLEQVPSHIIVIIDEAYAEYADAPDYPSTVKLLAHYPNLIVTRTFSKFYGLAGLRVGYLISHPSIAKHLHNWHLPFSVNCIALAAAEVALYDFAHREFVRVTNQQGRKQLIRGLKRLSLSTIPSQTNFICVDLEKNSLPTYEKLIREGIYVKSLEDHGLPNHLRISVGLESQNQQLLETLYTHSGRHDLC